MTPTNQSDQSDVPSKKGAFAMNEMMLEATRLTRSNRLSEATALIQRMLRGDTEFG